MKPTEPVVPMPSEAEKSEPEALASPPAKPTRRRATKAAPPAEAAIESEPTSEPAAAPAPRRRVRKASPSDAGAAALPAEVETPLAGRVTAASPAADPPVAADAAAAEPPAAPEPARPVRVRRKKVVAETAAGDAQDAERRDGGGTGGWIEPPPIVSAQAPQTPPDHRDLSAPAGAGEFAAAARVVIDEAPSEPAAGTSHPGMRPLGDAEPGGDVGGGVATGAESGPPGEGDAAAPREGGRRNRNRNRRRGRDRDRAERPARGDAPAAASAPGDDSVVPDSSQIAAPVLEPADPNEVFAQVVAGQFDEEPAAAEGPPAVPVTPRRVLAPEPDAPKLHKVLAQAGIGSRRDMEQWVLEGRVTVNGEPAHIGQRISFGDRIAIGGKPVKVRIAPPMPRVLAYHKPAGEVVTHDDPQHRPTVFRRLPRLQQGKWQSVGRLDLNTEGLLLFTNSGDLANQLMHPRFGVEREYAVRSLGVLDDEQRQRLLDGVEIDGQRAAFKSVEDGGGEGVNHWYRVVITEGRHREVRRLFEAVGHAVSRLIRIRYGCVVLPRGLKRGVWVDLSEEDVRSLRRLTGTDRRRDEPGRGRRGGRGSRARDGRPRDGQPDRGPRPERPPRAEGDGPMHIPNPLQQTFDKRAIQQARSPRRELGEDDPIPNPLQQTYDRRALQRDRNPERELPEDGPIPNPLQQTYDKRFVQKPGGGGRGGRGGARGGGPGGARQPDPMQTAIGYIGADAFHGRRGKGGRGGGRGGGPGGPKGGSGPRGGRSR